MEQAESIYPMALGHLLVARRNGGRTQPGQFECWCKDGQSVAQVIDHVGLELALDFALGSLTWEFCDWAANFINAERTFAFGRTGEQEIFSGDFDEIYQVFDASELEKPGAEAEFALFHIEEFLKRKGYDIRR